MLSPVHVLQAGGIVPQTAQPRGAGVDTLYAQHFMHPGLRGRRVVRLVGAQRLGASDVEMGIHGFRQSQAPAEVGYGAQRTLGFPAWALVHHPDKAHFALDIMRDFRKASALIVTKPGYARDAFVGLGAELERKAPAFLPSFWEEAGRCFIEQDNPKMAAVCFESARSAERSYGLPADETLRGQAYLEFALAGAVSAKSFSAYVQVLREVFGPEEALDRYLALNIHRIRGGQQPFASLPKELKRLAKDAKRKAIDVDTAFIEQVISAPALKRAPVSFWLSYLPALKIFAAQGEAQRAFVLNLWPDTGHDAKFITEWLQLLAQIGAVAHGEAADPHWTCAWVEAMTLFVGRALDEKDSDGQIFPKTYRDLLESLAPTLRANGLPLDLAYARSRWSNWVTYLVDLLEYALRLGLSLKPPFEVSDLKFGEHFFYDVEHLSQHADFRARLLDAVREDLGDTDFDASIRHKPHYTQLRHDLLAAQIQRLGRGGLGTLASAINTLKEKAGERGLADFPDLRAQLEAVQLAPVLQRSLRGGLLDEFTWPEFEAALNAFEPPAGERQPTIHLMGSLHFPIARVGHRVIVFDGPAVLRRYDLPPAIVEHVESLDYVCVDPSDPMQGDLCVSYWARGEGYVHIWMRDPQTRLDGHLSSGGMVLDRPFDDQRAFYGKRLLRVGASAAVRYNIHDAIAWDGAGYYRLERDLERGLRSFEWDPERDEKGRAAWPAPLRADSERADGFRLESAQLWSAPKGSESSPLGVHNGLIGGWTLLRKSAEGENEWISVRVDGLRHHSRGACGDLFLQMSGGTSLQAVRWWALARSDRQDGCVFLSDEGHSLLSFGSSGLQPTGTWVLPRGYWLHYLRPRDVRLSTALRDLSEAAAQAMLAAAAQDLPTAETLVQARGIESFRDPQRRFPQTFAAASAQLGGGDAVLIGAIAGAAIQARLIQLNWAQLTQRCAEPVEEDAPSLSDAQLQEHVPITLGWRHGEGAMMRALPKIAAVLSGAKAAAEPPEGALTWDIRWPESLDVLPRLFAFLMLRAHQPEEGRQRYRQFLAHWLEHCSAFFGTHLHVGNLKTAQSAQLFKRAVESDDRFFQTLPDGRVALVRILRVGDSTAQGDVEASFSLIALDLGLGAFAVPEGAVGEVRSLALADDRAFLEQLLALYDARGPVPYDLTTQAKIIDEAAQVSDLSVSGLRWLWAGMMNFEAYGHDFLGKALRTELDVKLGDVKADRDRLRNIMDDRVLIELWADFTRVAQPEELWGEGGLVQFKQVVQRNWPKKEQAFPEELLKQCAQQLDLKRKIECSFKQLLAMSEEGAQAAQLEAGDLYEEIHPQLTHLPVLKKDVFADFAQLLPHLAQTLPVGDPLLSALPAAYAHLRAHIRPDDLVNMGSFYIFEAAQIEAIFTQMGGEGGQQPLKNGQVLRYQDDGTLCLTLTRQFMLTPYFRVRDVQDTSEASARLMVFQEHPQATEGAQQMAAAVRVLCAPEMAQIIERVQNTPVPVGRFEADPRLSAPEIVAQVQAKHGISEEAAALYLLTLVHPLPTKKTAMEILGWKAAAYKKACEALVAAELFLEAKRARAGRAHFLPGPWEAKRGPMETWKLDNLELAFGTPQLIRPWFVAYPRAWARIEAGDAPRFEAAVRD